jgi:transposase-like protein
MAEHPYLAAIESLKLCLAALERDPPREERRILVATQRQELTTLEQLARSNDARLARIDGFNEEKRLTPQQTQAEKAQVNVLFERYRSNLKGRFSRQGAARWICATSGIPKKRVARYLKELPLDRGDALSADSGPKPA